MSDLILQHPQPWGIGEMRALQRSSCSFLSPVSLHGRKQLASPDSAHCCMHQLYSSCPTLGYILSAAASASVWILCHPSFTQAEEKNLNLTWDPDAQSHGTLRHSFRAPPPTLFIEACFLIGNDLGPTGAGTWLQCSAAAWVSILTGNIFDYPLPLPSP